MRPRTALSISAGALLLSFILPGILFYGLTTALPWVLGNEGWSFIPQLVIGLVAAHWTTGMLWGVALLVPLSALLDRLSPRIINGRKVLVLLLAIWAVPAAFVSRAVTPALREFRLTRPRPSECIAGVTLPTMELMKRERGAAIVGHISNMGKLHLTTLEAEFNIRPTPDDGAEGQGIVRTVFCELVQRESWDPESQPAMTSPRTLSSFHCEEPEIEMGTNPPTLEFVGFRSWGCKELGGGIYH